MAAVISDLRFAITGVFAATSFKDDGCAVDLRLFARFDLSLLLEDELVSRPENVTIVWSKVDASHDKSLLKGAGDNINHSSPQLRMFKEIFMNGQ